MIGKLILISIDLNYTQSKYFNLISVSVILVGFQVHSGVRKVKLNAVFSWRFFFFFFFSHPPLTVELTASAVLSESRETLHQTVDGGRSGFDRDCRIVR